jgi:two-component system sensor histidine kinase/response regulator
MAKKIAKKTRVGHDELSASLLRAMLESTTDGILVVDGENRISAYNRKFVEMWRIPARILKSGDDQKALTFVLEQLQRPADFLAKVRELYAAPNAESFDTLEFRDGRIFERYSRPQRVADRSVGRVWSFRDVTERIRAGELRSRLAAIVENSNDAIISRTPEGTILSWNAGAERMFGYTVAEAIGKDLRELLVPPDLQKEAATSRKLLGQGRAVQDLETSRMTKDGRRIEISLSIFPIKDARGNVVSVAAIARDISERKRT